MFLHLLRKFVPPALPERAESVCAAARVWHVLPCAAKVFGCIAPDVDGWPAMPVKQNLQRTITRVELPGGAVYVKRCRVNTPRAWVREMLRPAKARLEFENALLLRAKGVDCIEPLAWGATTGVWPGESIIVTREQPKARLLEDVLLAEMTFQQRRELTRSFAAFLAAMHNAGVVHPDPHPGNFLVSTEPSPRFALLDVHGVRFGRPLPWRAASGNLVLLNRWFQLRSSRTDRARFWKAYRTARIDSTAGRASEVEARTADSNREFWSARDARYLGNNRQFKRYPHGHAVSELSPDVVKGWFANPLPAGARILKDSPSTTVAETVLDGRAVIVKRFKLKKRFAVLRNLLRTSPARRSWLNGQHLMDRHIATARPLAYCYSRRFGIEGQGYVAFEKVPDACDLIEAVVRGTADADKLARLLRTMHDRDVRHRDLKATNILISGGEPLLIDLVGVSVVGRVGTAARQTDLARLAVSFLHSHHVRNTQRLRFLRTYLHWAPASWGSWKEWWMRIAALAIVKVERNRRTGRPLA